VNSRCVAVLAVLFFNALTPAIAQPDKDAIIQNLIARVEALERELAALKQSTVPGLESTAAPTNAARPEQPTVHEAAPAQDDSRFTFHGYADLGFQRNVDGDASKRFALGEVDLFASTRISPRVSALWETVLETDNQVLVASVPVNLERLLLQYRCNDYFHLDAGSYRTAIGYYSTAYLRGSWLQTAITRPRLFEFEDDGGFLPLHNVGLSAHGKLPSGALGLHYVVEVGSSRNYGESSAGYNFSQNAAVNLALCARPQALPGLEVGFSSYHDRFSPQQDYSMARSVWTGHLVYQAHRIEFLNEAVWAKFRNPKDGYGNVPGFYSQLAYRLGGSWSPYVRLEDIHASGTGTVGEYAPQIVPWRTAETVGARYDLTDAIAVKFEGGRGSNQLRSWIQAAVQVAFTF